MRLTKKLLLLTFCLLVFHSSYGQNFGDTVLVLTGDGDCCTSLKTVIHLSNKISSVDYEGLKSTKALYKKFPHVKVLIYQNPEHQRKEKLNISKLGDLTTVIFVSNYFNEKKEFKLSKSILDKKGNIEIILLDGLVIDPEQLKIINTKNNIRIKSIN